MKRIITIIVIAIIFVVYVYFSGIQKGKKEERTNLQEKTIIEQQIIIKSKNETIKSKTNQQKIISKSVVNNNILERRQWLQSIYAKRKSYYHK